MGLKVNDRTNYSFRHAARQVTDLAHPRK